MEATNKPDHKKNGKHGDKKSDTLNDQKKNPPPIVDSNPRPARAAEALAQVELKERVTARGVVKLHAHRSRSTTETDMPFFGSDDEIEFYLGRPQSEEEKGFNL